MPSVFARPNKFKGLSYGSSLNVDMGKLYPVYAQPVVPGDEFKVGCDAMARLMPMLAPLYGSIDMWLHFFFVPNRLVWDNFEDFVTNGLENGTTTAVHPYITGGTSTVWNTGAGLPDYFSAGTYESGQPDSVQAHKFDALPYRAYNKIYNDWYKSEYLQTDRTFSTADGSDTTTDLTLAYRCWPRDYYTSALPFRQLGLPTSIGLAGTAPVIGTGKTLGLSDGSVTGAPFASTYNNSLAADFAGAGQNIGTTAGTATANNKLLGLSTDKTLSGVVADLSALSAVTVNDLRTAFQLQRIMERKARSGNRYVEYIASSFGVRSPDARLQRAEFLGGGKTSILVSEILQTSSSTSTSPQGNMTGHGFGASRTFAFNKGFVEHGWVIGILSVLPKAQYFQGTPRIFLNKESWTDYYQPELAHLGEQAIYKEEVFRVANDVNARQVWGYQPMYEEMRRRNDEVHGDFRTNLNYWTTSRSWNTAPALNGTFVSCDASGIQSNIFAAGAQAVRPVLLRLEFSVLAVRPLSKHGNPGYIDH